VTWPDDRRSFFPVAHLRRLSPSAETKALRQEMERNPLAVLPASALGSSEEPLTIVDAEFVGNYAIKLVFSDGHDTGIFSWEYLREIDPTPDAEAESPRDGEDEGP